MTSRSKLRWDDISRRGIACSGWSPCVSSDLSFDYINEEDVIVMVYEDLRPGPLACCLFSLPPLIIFAPCFCPILSVTSTAYMWEFKSNPRTNTWDCLMRTKSFYSEDIKTFEGVVCIRLESRQVAHTSATSDGGTETSSITIHRVVMDHSLGAYEFPELPYTQELRDFVSAAQRALGMISAEHSPVTVTISQLDMSPNENQAVIQAHAVVLDGDDNTPQTASLEETGQRKEEYVLQGHKPL